MRAGDVLTVGTCNKMDTQTSVAAALAALGTALLNVTLIQVTGYVMKDQKLIPASALAGIGDERQVGRILRPGVGQTGRGHGRARTAGGGESGAGGGAL